ncbi:hypothetical protein Lalb_Chr00c49g0413081 [Lupinus albus]|uniref:Uncharacterized protein n=1 Tax=Lupinus albus TaxID=3870 RepID=A0A6A4MZX6_LUPAL|nr:hypothetical protein Lalb_Chr00c49g0413081 [Lupinus albus]
MKNFQRYNLGPYTHIREESMVHRHSASGLVEAGQCHYPYESYIADYVSILDFHINTNRDVDSLIQNDVLVNRLGDTDSVTNVYNGLWKNITHLNFSSHYIHLCLYLNAFCSLMNYKDAVNNIKGMLERAESPITGHCCIYRDQLPFLFLRAFISGSGNIPSFLFLKFDYFANYNSCNLASDNIIIRHFTDLFRMFHLQQPMERRPHSIEELVVHRHSASGLVEAGVIFKVNAKTKCLLELKFSRGCLKSHNSGWRMTHNFSFAILLLWSNFTILMSLILLTM